MCLAKIALVLTLGVVGLSVTACNSCQPNPCDTPNPCAEPNPCAQPNPCDTPNPCAEPNPCATPCGTAAAPAAK